MFAFLTEANLSSLDQKLIVAFVLIALIDLLLVGLLLRRARAVALSELCFALGALTFCYMAAFLYVGQHDFELSVLMFGVIAIVHAGRRLVAILTPATITYLRQMRLGVQRAANMTAGTAQYPTVH